ncbi:hypothetical protein MPTK1_5g03980 [Marchantia polymorpha subsp. ruderalis]|nr:hypothetical protein MARPO_0141s0006 [Marchantia polymorpha]BBN10493.1 hypothetical protein Mp_5g03980 [Marchantia polymorpha subsp. ruderalis]|eukprot:PTQ29423.1 hypothetical protein MARPO_0141s0006 [Marchantia polymorpha]
MEVSSSVGILNARPPRLEDAGLEDCALPAHAIQEAFRRAAGAVRNVSSVATGILGGRHESDEECTHNPGPSNGIWEDKCLGSSGKATLGEKESCVDQKAGGLLEEGHDLLVQGGDEVKSGKLLVGSEVGPKLGGRACVGEDEEEDSAADPEESEGGPILIGAYM